MLPASAQAVRRRAAQRPAGRAARGARAALRRTGGAGGAVLTELRVRRARRPLTDRWQRVPVQPRGRTQLGISFRPLQAEALGLDPRAALRTLLALPLRGHPARRLLGPAGAGAGQVRPGELDRLLDAAEQAGKQIILGVGAVKTFGYPEFFVPAHQLDRPLPEGTLVTPEATPRLLRRGHRVPRPGSWSATRDRRRDHRLAGRARGRRPAGHGALLAAVRGVRRAPRSPRCGRPTRPARC